MTLIAAQVAPRLSDRSHDVHSQFGEDGIIAAIFERLGEGERRSIEFGAWDGFYLSNTANLWTRGWTGVLIEADRSRFEQLVANTSDHECRCLHAFVGIEPGTTLEDILSANGLPLRADLLSIDVDGDDYYIFRSLGRLRPRVVCCEYNPTFPPHLDLRPEPGARFGCSPLSLLRLAESKGYRLVAVTEGNLLFVREEDFPHFAGYETSFEVLADRRHVNHLISGFDGSYVLSRQPTYACRRPSQHPFVGTCYRPGSSSPSRPRRSGPRRLVSAVRRKLRRSKPAPRSGDGIDPEVLAAWRRDQGDLTLRLDYPLGPDSVVVDAGGFRGQWASDVFAMYGCRVEVFEPLPDFAAAIRRRFANNPRIRVHGFGLAAAGGRVRFFADGDGSSTLRGNGPGIVVEMRGIGDALAELGLGEIDLLKVNIEGGEYELLEQMLDSGLIERVRDLQVQFHPFVERAAQRRAAIRERLAESHEPTYDYPFVWEGWRRRELEAPANG